ncbi:hypothetical protein VTO42DRAFT_5611 [Malbranchea cinnamomea]
MDTPNTSYPVSVSQLHFPSAAQNLSHILSDLRRSTLSITNRLKSIESDSHFVQSVADHYELALPLVANERCGSWYIPPDKKGGSAYFKSTDGHAGQWDFSLRRLNLQILDIVNQHGGCIIVDSTRRGKAMPDALSKTVPIWCAVMNRTLFPEATAYHDVHLPPNLLPASEESQIERRIDGFVASLKTLNLNLQELKARMGKPVRLAWATRDYIWPEYPADRDFHLIVLCSASRRVRGAEMSEGGYIQGAGDDSEGWAFGLTPPVFWKNKETLFNTAEEDLPALIEQLVKEHRWQAPAEQGTRIKPTSNLYIGKSDTGGSTLGSFDLLVDCNTTPRSSEDSKCLKLGLPPGKLGSRTLRKILDQVESFISTKLSPNPFQSVLVVCENGKDLSVGVALAIICLFYDDQGAYRGLQKTTISKQYIRQRLAWIVSSKHDVNPSRSTLQSVNSFLMERPES